MPWILNYDGKSLLVLLLLFSSISVAQAQLSSGFGLKGGLNYNTSGK
ncbi:hypothetical protein [Algoriphagus boritolerans]|uniref:PorT family protein n=1 Tax=Algoriphagus boritolerans DSM 17298 = JCM 18970 TaxID=1120964 RepID=A0A1H5RYS2_9BACT|nr:hypothetical protein [Algoriphagus boritolerans]SEF43506.1 hypothetical protein SAMN03080598_00192 [Algoriphagus boritolerans DSM 17298 = JCM 18970]